MLKKKYFSFLKIIFILFFIFFYSPQSLKAQVFPRLPLEDLPEDIDNFVQGGAIGFLLWDWDGSIPGSEACSILKQKSEQYPGVFFGTNLFDLANHDSSYISNYLSGVQSCGGSVVRLWGVNPGTSPLELTAAKLQNALNSTPEGMQLVIALGDYANGFNDFTHKWILQTELVHTNPAPWYQSGYITNGHPGFVAEAMNAIQNHPKLWGVELMNEAHCAEHTDAIPYYNNWVADLSNQIAGKASHIGIGQANSLTGSVCDYPGGNFIDSNTQGSINVTSGHFYEPTQRSNALAALGKSPVAFYVGEAGYDTNGDNPFDENATQCIAIGPDIEPEGAITFTQETDPEHNSLRPYPTCPYDPSYRDLTYYSCGNDLTITETLTTRFFADPKFTRLPKGVTLLECTEVVPNVTYLCSYEIHRTLPMKIDFSQSELPITGLVRSPYVNNSQNYNEAQKPITDDQKVNYYVSWYMNGLINHAENVPLSTGGRYPYQIKNPNDDTAFKLYKREQGDMRSLIDYSGPINKLLPWRIQSQLKEDIAKAPKHNQISACIYHMNVPGILRALWSGSIDDFYIPGPCWVKYDDSGFFKILGFEIPFININVERSTLREDAWTENSENFYTKYAYSRDDFYPPHDEDYEFNSLLDPDYDPLTDYAFQYQVWRGEICLPIINPYFKLYYCFNDPGDIVLKDYYSEVFPYINKASTEDMTGYATVSDDMTDQVPGDVQNLGVYFDPSDDGYDGQFRNLYFAHIEEDTKLGYELQKTFMPHGRSGFSGGSFRNIYNTKRCELKEYRGGAGDPLRPDHEFKPDQDTLTRTARVSQNTTGDKLAIDGDLNYGGTFTCTYNQTVDQSCLNDCVFNVYGFGPEFFDPNDPVYIECARYCTEWNECETTANASTSIYNVMPRSEELWERYVNGNMSIFKSIFPRIADESDRPIKKLKEIAGRTYASYSANTDVDADSGEFVVGSFTDGKRSAPGGTVIGNIFFDKLGSIKEYFLLSTQKALRPKSIGILPSGSGDDDAGPGDPDDKPDSSINCNQNIPDSEIPTEYLGGFKENIIRIANDWSPPTSLTNHAEECYNDVIKTSLDRGVNPLFTLSIWLNECDASNYEGYPGCGDFGLITTSLDPEDFTGRLNLFLNLPFSSTYTDRIPGDPNCSGAENLTDMNIFMNIFLLGASYCNGISPDYIDQYYYKAIFGSLAGSSEPGVWEWLSNCPIPDWPTDISCKP